MNTHDQVTVSATADEDRAIATLTMAFAADPVVRWFLPRADTYLKFWPPFVRAFGGNAFAHGSADSVDDCCGVALWLPPGVSSDDEAMGALSEEAVPPADQEEVFGVLGQMAEFHPIEPHWYLPVIGVDFTRQGQGYGSALMRHALERCDRDGVPAYLEATGPRNKRLYAAHGFEEVGVIQGGSSPPLWPMLRPAQ